MPATRDFLEKKIQRNAIDEYLANRLRSAEYGGCEIRHTPLGDKVILKAGRVGLAIGGRGRTIQSITRTLRDKFHLDNPQVEVSQVENPELDARVMAYRLASSLERGRHFRRSAHGIIRRILSSGAKGVEIIISGKITSQRARVETFRAGFVAKCGEPSKQFVDEGKATALIRRGKLGVKVRIMHPDAVLPDDIEIIAEPTARGSMDVNVGGSEEIIEEEEIEEISEDEELEALDEVDELDELDEVDEAAEPEELVQSDDLIEEVTEEVSQDELDMDDLDVEEDDTEEETKKSLDYKAKEAISLMKNMSYDEIIEFTKGDERKTILKFLKKSKPKDK